jgi:CRP/FNR family cyclic AMP-dependent transcriptional regulator
MTWEATRSLLRSVRPFEDLDDRELALLGAVMSGHDLAEGDVVFREGDPGSCCYFIVEGEVEVRKKIAGNAERTIATLRKDQAFGHIALVDPGPRSATCVCTRATRVLQLDRADFDTLFLSGTRFALRFQDLITRMIAEQLRAANRRLALLSLDAVRPKSAEQRKKLQEIQDLLELSNYQ